MESDIKIDTYYIDIFLSISLGILLSFVMYTMYVNPRIVKGPNSRDIIDKVFEIDNKYYKFVPIVCGCLPAHK